MPIVRPWDRDRILAHIEPIVPLLHEVTEAATQEARTFFDGLSLREAQERDPYLYAHLVRFHAGKLLVERGQDARVDKYWLANSGIAFRYGWADVRLLKSAAGRLPAPGRSITKRRFYSQYISMPIWDQEGERSGPLVNLVITWDVDFRGNLSELVVYSPSEGGNTADSVHWHWRHQLEHPAMTYTPPPPVEPDEEGEDLDIERDIDEADDSDIADAQ